MTFRAFWLPGVQVAAAPWPGEGEGAAAGLVRPVLRAEDVRREMEALRTAREAHLAERPVAEILRAIDRVAERLLDPDDALRRDALDRLPPVTGLSPEMAELTLDRMAADWRADRLRRLLEVELGDPAVLDRFVARGAGGRVHAVGPAVVFHVFSGNVPGVGVTSMIRALLVKAASLGKTASGEPVLPVLFARGLAEVDAGLGRCVAVAYWPGGMAELEDAAIAGADVVVAYGSTSSIEALRARVPAGTRMLEYGSRLSFAVVAREALTGGGARDVAADAALAVATFDQQGCVSPHLVYVEEGGGVSPADWARLLAGEMARLETVLPRGRIPAQDAAAIQQLRGRVEVAGLTGGGDTLHASAGDTSWTVLFERDPSFEASCLNRVVRVKPVRSIEEVPGLAAGLGAVLQTVGAAGPDERLAPLALALARLGVTRVAPLDEMPWPRPWWHHDGRPAVGDLVRWCDWE